MPILALALLLSSAILHALWNLLLKKSEQKYLAMGWQVIIGSIISAFLLVFTGLPPQSIWILVIISTILEAIYFGLLTYAYNDHDFSLVYPVARGAAPAMVLIWTALFLDEIPSTGGFIGILMIVVGLAIIGATSLLQGQSVKPNTRGIVIALSVAFVISLYTLVDGYAVKHSPALPFGLGLFLLMPLFTTPLIIRNYGWKSFFTSFQDQSKRLILVGLLALIAYLSALYAYSIAPVNYSEAIREVSVVLGAFAGWYFLGEKMGKIRVIGALVIFAGIVMIAVYG